MSLGSEDPRIARLEEGYAALTAGDVEAAIVGMHPEEWIDAGELIVRIGGVRGKGRGSGVEVAMVGAQVIEFTDVLASRVTLYQTKEEALAAVSGSAA